MYLIYIWITPDLELMEDIYLIVRPISTQCIFLKNTWTIYKKNCSGPKKQVLPYFNSLANMTVLVMMWNIISIDQYNDFI